MLTSTRAARLAKLPRRETQQKRMYDSETFLWGTAVGTTQAEVQAYVEKVANYEWFRRRWGTQRFNVDTRNGLGGHGGYGNVMVGLNKTARLGYEQGAQRNVVLHEMGHTLAGGDGGNWHGPQFARTMLELVRYAVGAAEAKQLRANYKTNRVKVAPPTPLRSTEGTPAPRTVQPTKLWRFEFKHQGVLKTHEVEATSMKGALYHFQNSHERVLAEATNLRIWRGVRKAAAKPTPRKRG
jgi:putative metallohydrolase (TIGR04338 family)